MSDAPSTRQRVGFWLGVGGGLVILALPAGELGVQGLRAAAMAWLMACWWISEALPIAVTALVPLSVAPILGILTLKKVAVPYAHPIVYLFLGGFLIALAMERWNLHRRIALNILARTGSRPSRLIWGFMLATAGLSMWVSNTATTMMMLPIAVSVIGLLKLPNQKDVGIAMMLGIAYAANIGGMGTIIGTFPNALLAAYLEDQMQIKITMLEWMMRAMPLVVVLLPTVWWLICVKLHRVDAEGTQDGAAQALRREREGLGPMSLAEKRVAIVFSLTAILWIVRPFVSKWLPPHVDLADGAIAIGAGILLFIIPSKKGGEALLNWHWARKLPWGLPLLIGGGLSLAEAIKTSGLSAWLGAGLGQLSVVHEALGGSFPLAWVVIPAIVLLIVFLTEITSNTATTAVFLPILAALAIQTQIPVFGLLLPAVLAASCAFMLPVATPPNAIVYGSGLLKIRDMSRAGLRLNFLAWFILSSYGCLVILLT